LKAIKHLPEHKIRRYADDETVTSFSMMTALQVHVRGYVPIKNEETGIVKKNRVDVFRGNGPETLYIDAGIVRDEQALRNRANLVYQQYVLDVKRNADGTLVGSEHKAEQKREFTSSRPGKKFNKKKHQPRPFIAKEKKVDKTSV